MLRFVLLISCFVLFQSFIKAQDNQVIGVSYSLINDFGFIYKKQLKENRFIRFTAGSFNVGVDNNSSLVTINGNPNFVAKSQAGVALTVGLEMRKPIDNHFNFIHGLAFTFDGSYTLFETDDFAVRQFNAMPGIGYMLGAQYFINDNLHVDIEMLPTLFVEYTSSSGNVTQQNFGGQIDMQSVSINFCYQFKKVKKGKK